MKLRSWAASFIFVASLLTPNLNLFSEAGINAYVLSHGNGNDGFVGVFETDIPFTQTASIGSSFSNPTGMVYTVVPVVPPTVPPTDHELVYVAATDEIDVIDVLTGTLVAPISITGNTAFDVAATSNGAFVYATIVNVAQVLVIDTSTNTVVGAPIPVGNSPEGIAITPSDQRAYVANGADGTVSVINTISNTVVATVTVGTVPTRVAITPNGNSVYVVNTGSDNVSVINTATNTVVATITVGDTPINIAIATVQGGAHVYAYVTNGDSDTVTVIDTDTMLVVGSPIIVGLDPGPIAATPDGTSVFVGIGNNDTLSIIDTATNVVTNVPGILVQSAIVMVPAAPPPPPQPQPPSNLTGQLRKVIFATQTEYIHQLQWSPSIDTTVVDYILFRNGSQIAVISASGPLEYNDQNRHKNESDIYSLVSVNASGVQSDPITLVFTGK